MNNINERYFINNGTIKELEQSSEIFNSHNTSVYEVIRVLDGIPLFLEEHLDRLDSSCKLVGSSYSINRTALISDIKKLISQNKCFNKNFKILVSNLDSNNPNILLYFVESKYPSRELYLNGVHCILYKAERKNPNAKIIVSSFRDTVNEELKKQNAYEAILLNQSNEITEGSRSNIFFVKDNVLFTPPSDEVLKGITRKRIIDLCNKLNISIIEEKIPVDFLKDVDGIFLTGTSPKILPIASVEDKIYNSQTHELIVKLIDEYNIMIYDYIKNFTFN